MKTAMQELIPELIKLRGFGIEIKDEYIQGLLEKEKQQIEEARLKGYGEGYNEGVYDGENK